MIHIGLIGELFALHAARLVLYARQWLERAAAEDVVQDVFARLMARPAMPAEPVAWLYRSVRNATLDVLRSGRRRGSREALFAASRREWFDPRPDDLIDAADAQAAIEALPIEQRETIVLRIWAQMSYQQIADVTAAPLSTVYDRYRAGLASVRKMMESSCQKPNRT